MFAGVQAYIHGQGALPYPMDLEFLKKVFMTIEGQKQEFGVVSFTKWK